MNTNIPPAWRALYEELNGRNPNARDDENSCEAFEQTDNPDGSGECMTDGHYMCVECKHICLTALRRKRDQCEDCGAKLSFENSRDGDCPNECDVPEYILRGRLEYARLEQASE